MSNRVRLGDASERDYVRAIERHAFTGFITIPERLTKTRKQEEDNEGMIGSAHPFNASSPLYGIKDYKADAVYHLAVVERLLPCSPKHG